MKIFEYDEAKQVVVCGDIHGAFETMVFKACVQYGMTDTLIIVAGDCGFGFERPNHYINLYNGLRDWAAYDPQLLVDCDMERITIIVLEILDIIMLCEHNVPEAYFILRQMSCSSKVRWTAFAPLSFE